MVNFVEEGSEAYEAEVMEEYFIVSINGTRIEGWWLCWFLDWELFIYLFLCLFTIRRQLLRRSG